MKKIEGVILILSCQKHLNTRLKQFKLPKNNYENWEEKVFVRFNTNQSIDSSWKVLFNLCDVKKLAEFTETFKELLLHISVIEQNIMDFNMNDYERRNLYDQIDDDIYFLSEKFIECIDLSKFKEIKN